MPEWLLRPLVEPVGLLRVRHLLPEIPEDCIAEMQGMAFPLQDHAGFDKAERNSHTDVGQEGRPYVYIGQMLAGVR